MTSFIDDNGNELEYDGKDFAVTKQAISFRDFKLRGSFSTNIKISNTARNRYILGYYGDAQINPTTKKRFSIYRDGNKVDSGHIVIAGKDDDFIELFFVSGNSNLFEAIDFKCNEIVTTRYDTRDVAFNVINSWSKTEGIIFPIMDFMMKGEKYGNVFYTNLQTDTDVSTDTMKEFVPCCYVHTILREVLGKANIAFSGNLFDDPFFKTLAITPNSVDDVRAGPPNNTYQGGKLASNILKPEYIAPNIKVVEFLKWISISFGCLMEYDTESNSLTFDLMDNRDLSAAQDWSDYYISSGIKTDKYYDKSYIRYSKSDENYQESYNLTKDVYYGDMLIESGKGDESSKDIYTSIFKPSYDVVGSTRLKYATPVCEMYRLKDDKGFTFSSVSTGGTAVSSGDVVSGLNARFNGTGFPFTTTSGIIFRVNTGTYKGYHVSVNASSTFIESDMPFLGNSSGTLFTQTHEKITGHKVVSIVTGISPRKFTQYNNIKVDGPNESNNTTVATGYFSKKVGVYGADLNSSGAYSQGLQYDTIAESGRRDKSLKDVYMKTLTKIISNPPYKCKFRLPQDIFYKYTNQFIFVKAKDLNGYFFVDKIENYVDSITPVTCYLSKI